MSKPNGLCVLVVDDEPDMCLALEGMLEQAGYAVETCQMGKDALKVYDAKPADAVILDLKLPDMTGLQVLEKIRESDADAQVIISTGFGDVETAVDAIKKGAFHYLSKPFKKAEILLLLKKAVDESRARRKTAVLEQQLERRRVDRGYVLGSSAAMKRILDQVERVAPTDMTVILEGESGAGKEGLARILHQKSARSHKPFVAVDCGTLPEGLAENELFGHEKGAFTGADERRHGQFECADGGTLFLDEIGNLPPAIQAKLLRAIQERKVRPLGAKRDIPVDVRIIVATNEDLEADVRQGAFREDLYHRLNEFTLRLPPLRERPEDIAEFTEFFLRDAQDQLHKELDGISDEALELLKRAPWPGNLRQLKNVVRGSALLADGRVEAEHVEPLLGKAAAPAAPAEGPRAARRKSLKQAAQQTEKKMIVDALKRAGNNKAEAARLLKMDRSVLYDKLRRYRIKKG